MTDNEIIKAQTLIKKLEEAYNAYYDTSKAMPYDIDTTLRETAICLENSLAEISRQKAEIEKLKEASEEAVSCFHRMESLYNIKRMELKVAKAEAIKEFATAFENALTNIETFYFEEEHEDFISANKVIALLYSLSKEKVGE